MKLGRRFEPGDLAWTGPSSTWGFSWLDLHDVPEDPRGTRHVHSNEILLVIEPIVFNSNLWVCVLSLEQDDMLYMREGSLQLLQKYGESRNCLRVLRFVQSQINSKK